MPTLDRHREPQVPQAQAHLSRSARRFYPESSFGGFTDIDGTVAFYARVNALLSPRDVVLDYGCGRGTYRNDPVPFRRSLRVLKGKVAKVIGTDVDPETRNNEWIDEFRPVEPGQPWPVEDDSIDLVLCDDVLEHLQAPEQFFAECSRVLRPRGYLCIRTPNLLSYVGLISRIVPNKYHGAVLKMAQDGRQDCFPTFHRCNTVWAVRRMMRKHGFEHVVYGYEAEPSYLGFSRLAYALGVVHQKLAPGFLRPAIFAFGRKL